MTTLTQPIKWHGGKHYLADWIIGHMVPHTHYVEPYFGGGSVLLRKDPEGISEVANDIDQELIEFWSVLRCPRRFERFTRAIQATPFAERQFNVTLPGQDPRVQDDMTNRALRFFVRARQSRQGLGKAFATLSRNRTRRGMNEQVASWLTAIDGLADVHTRLKRVVLLDRPALETIRQQDGENTLFYLDPPYLHGTRVTTKDYAFEMTWEDHAVMLGALTHIKGKFLLSGYQSVLYDVMEEKHGWHRAEIQIDNKASSKKIKEIKTECLWMNYKPPLSAGSPA